jgi:hypothetical protein
LFCWLIPALLLVCIEAAVRAKIATEYTDIGGFNVKVAVE